MVGDLRSSPAPNHRSLLLRCKKMQVRSLQMRWIRKFHLTSGSKIPYPLQNEPDTTIGKIHESQLADPSGRVLGLLLGMQFCACWDTPRCMSTRRPCLRICGSCGAAGCVQVQLFQKNVRIVLDGPFGTMCGPVVLVSWSLRYGTAPAKISDGRPMTAAFWYY